MSMLTVPKYTYRVVEKPEDSDPRWLVVEEWTEDGSCRRVGVFYREQEARLIALLYQHHVEMMSGPVVDQRECDDD